jgi:hypothetical protein
MFKNIRSRWSMKPTGNSFRDIVTGDKVQDWIDYYGVKWMAVNKWGFRVRKNSNGIDFQTYVENLINDTDVLD